MTIETKGTRAPRMARGMEMSQSEVAEKLGVSRDVVKNLELSAYRRLRNRAKTDPLFRDAVIELFGRFPCEK